MKKININTAIKRMIKEKYGNVIERISVTQGHGTACGWKHIKVILKSVIVWNREVYTKEQYKEWCELDWKTRMYSRKISNALNDIKKEIEQDIVKNFKDEIGYYYDDDLYNTKSSEMIVQVVFE